MNQLLVGTVALAMTEIALAGVPVGTTVGAVVGIESGSLIAVAAGGIALGIWIIRRNKNK